MLFHLAASPTGFAQLLYPAQWRPAAHLATLDRALLAAAASPVRLVVAMPPRHGKSELCSRFFPAWFLGIQPDRRVLLASYEADFARRWGRHTRMLVAAWGWLFGVSLAVDSSAAQRWDLAGRRGGMSTAGVGGALTGKGANLLVIDDPIKNASEVRRQQRRQALWDWWETTARTRLEPGGAVLVVQTRWHEDDLAGRLEQTMAAGGELWCELRFPALSHPADAMGRDDDERLWPERWRHGELDERRTALGTGAWCALYQQRPVPPSGGMFRREMFTMAPALPTDTTRAVRYWDKAATADHGDYTAGVLMAEADGRFYVADVLRGRWSPAEREQRISDTANHDSARFGSRVSIWLEQEPGSGGKESAEATIRRLAGFRVHAERVTGDKTSRADPLACQAERGLVLLVQGAWNEPFIDELIHFPHGVHDDQVDAAAGAFLKLARRQAFEVHV